MTGFANYDSIISQLTIAGTGQTVFFEKQAGTTAADAWYTTWNWTGSPIAGTYGTTKSGRQVTSASQGVIAFVDAGGSDTLHMTKMGGTCSAAAGTLLLYDRLLDYAAFDHTDGSPQNTSGSGLSRYTTGAGVQMFMEVTGALGSSTDALITYTNQAGTGGRTTTVSMIGSAAVNRLAHNELFIPLQAGDTGVRSVETVDFSASGGGESALVLCKPIDVIPMAVANVWVERDMVIQTPKLFEIKDAAAIAGLVFVPGNINAVRMYGMLDAVAG